MEYITLSEDYFGDFIGWDFHASYYDELFEDNKEFRFVADSSVDLLAKLAIDAINLLLENKKFIEKNALITKRYTVWDYFRDLYFNYIDYYYENEFEIKLESKKVHGIILQAYFTKEDLKYMKGFQAYNVQDNFDWEPATNWDIRVVRRASMKLLHDKLVKFKVSIDDSYELLDLNNMRIWDYGFSVELHSDEYKYITNKK